MNDVTATAPLGVVADGDGSSGPVPVRDPWSQIESIALGIDRQLEGLRVVAARHHAGAGDPVIADVRRTATDVAVRCGAVAAMEDEAATQTARSLASLSALAVLLLDVLEAPATEHSDRGDAQDVVQVLGDSVIEQYRSLVHTAVEGRVGPTASALPIELFLRQLDDGTPNMTAWPAAAIWMGMALKVAEAAQWWPQAAAAHEPERGAL